MFINRFISIVVFEDYGRKKEVRIILFIFLNLFNKMRKYVVCNRCVDNRRRRVVKISFFVKIKVELKLNR